MRILIWAVVAVAALLVIAVGALAVFLPRIVKSDAVRARIETAAEDAIGREVRYDDLEVGLLPPSLVVVGASVAGERGSDAPLAEAERVSLRVALAPLLARAVVVDTLVVDGATLRLERTADGLVLPKPAAAGGGAPGEAPDAGSSVALAVRAVRLRGASIDLRDRAVTPAVDWQLRDVDASVRGRSLEDPFEVEASLQLGSGGRLEVEGTAGLDGAIDLALELDALSLAPFAPYVEALSQLAGVVSGRISAKGPAANPREMAVDVVVRDGVLRIGEIDVRGKMQVDASLSGADASQGSFRIDATDAQVSYGGVHTRPVGEPKRVTGNLLRKSDGSVEITDFKLKAGPVDGDGSAVIGPRTRIVANVAPVDLRELRAFVPQLAEYDVSGPFRLQGFRIATSPLELHGDIPLDGVKATLPEGGPVTLRGGLVAEGDRVRTRDLQLVAADQIISVDGSVSGLAGTPRYRVRTETRKSETNRLVSTFTSSRDRLYGPLDFDGDVSGTLTGGADLWQSLEGSMRFSIQQGRLVGVSILEKAFEQFDPTGVLGGLGQLGLARVASVDLRKYAGDEFELLSGTLEFARGQARSDDFQLVYRDYRVDLQGLIDLADLGLDMRGQLTLGAEIGAELSRQLTKAVGLGAARAGDRFVVPLPAVQGTLSEPRVRADFSQLSAALLRNLGPVRAAPGSDLPAEALKGLGDLLGGGRKR